MKLKVRHDDIFSKENIERAFRESTEDQKKVFHPEKKTIRLIPFLDRRAFIIMSMILFILFLIY